MIVVVGGGVVGLHVGLALAGLPGRPPIVVCEREPTPGAHTSTRNSEVIHAGFAYPEDSLKARFCVEGNPLTYEWLQRLGVAHVRSGKWITAASAAERAGLEEVLRVGALVGVPGLRVVEGDELARAEPGGLRALAAVHSPTSGILDAAAYVAALARCFEAHDDCHLLAPCAVRAVDPMAREIVTSQGRSTYTLLVNAAGLWADEVFRLTGGGRRFRIVPFKGEYYRWRRGPILSLIYGVPRRYLPGTTADPRLVSHMGIHAHRAVDGTVYVGPTQADRPADRKDDYRIETPREVFAAAAAAIARLADPDDLEPAYAGNRPKLYEGPLPIGDFHIESDGAHVHLLGIESPGLTAAPALARHVAELVRQRLA